MKNLLLSVVSCVVLVTLVEVVFRVFDWWPPKGITPSESRAELFVADSAVGYHLWPSTRTCMRYPPGAHRVLPVVSNRAGFASSRELDAADPRPRAMVFGDSFTFGVGVEESARFTEVVEQVDPRWRVDNIGMPGWGLDLMVRALERYGPAAKPSAVVLAVYTDDFRRLNPRYPNVGFEFDKFELRKGALVSVPYPTLTWWRRLHVVELLREVVESRDADYFALNEALVDRFARSAAAMGAVPVLLFLPGKDDIAADKERRGRLGRWAAARHIAFRDLTDPIHSAGVRNVFLKKNPHWNEAGHRIAGQILASLLDSAVVTTAGQPVDSRLAGTATRSVEANDYCRDAGNDSSAVVSDGGKR